MCVKNPAAKTGYAASVSRVPVFKNIEVQVGKEHCVFVMSADLQCQGKSKTPWLDNSAPDEKVFEAMLEFLAGDARGPSDVIVAWDGGMRSARRSLEDGLAHLPATAEVFIVYKNAWNSWIKRKAFLGSDTREVGYITVPQNRTKHAVQVREDEFKGAGEESSHWTTYSGVVPAARRSLARVSLDDKAAIWPKASKDIPEKWIKNVGSGVPMFWGETKPLSFWVTLLTDLRGGCVVDVTPGSGTLASACMSLGIQYLGLVGNPTHLTWLTNVIDREALKYICTGGNLLYQEDLAKVIEELFADVVEENDVQDEEIVLTDVEA